jgi:predicted nucleic acid-binding protein
MTTISTKEKGGESVAADPSQLPARALLDTGVVLRALGEFPDDPHSAICQRLFDVMLEADRELLIAAPTIAEVMRKDGKKGIPKTPGIEVVSFDLKAAEILGTRMPITTLKDIRDQSAGSLTHLKYDALIVACAVRHGAECIIAIDADIAKLAKFVGLTAFHPGELRIPTGQASRLL